jgi:hypothetical protein
LFSLSEGSEQTTNLWRKGIRMWVARGKRRRRVVTGIRVITKRRGRRHRISTRR